MLNTKHMILMLLVMLFTSCGVQNNTSVTDVAQLTITGEGYFILDDNGITVYARGVTLGADDQGYWVNQSGYRVKGFLADSAGTIIKLITELLVSSLPMPPNDTDQIGLIANLNSAANVTGFIFTAASNEDIYFSDDNGTTYYTADLISNGGLVAGTAYTGAQVASAIKTAMEAANGTTDTYTVTYNATDGEFTIANDTGNGVLILDWSNAASTAEAMLGYSAVSSGAIAAGTGSDVSDLTAGAFFATDADNTSIFSTSITVYDSLGNSHPVSIYFRKDIVAAGGNTWEWFAMVAAADSANAMSTASEVQASGIITFNTNGALSAVSTVTYPTGGFDFAGGPAQNQMITFDFGTSIAAGGTGLDGTTQFNAASSVTYQSQDGYPSGLIVSYTYESDGTIKGNYDNSQSRTLGQFVLAIFSSPTLLATHDQYTWEETSGSGPPTMDTPGSNGYGLIQVNN